MQGLSFPRIREAPAEVVRGLCDVDPRTAVLWWGPATELVDQPVPRHPWETRPVPVVRPAWLVGIVDPYRAMNGMAARRCRTYQEASLVPDRTESAPAFAQRCRMFRQRAQLARLAYQGFVAKFFWYAQDLDSELVLAYQEMGWFARHLFEVIQRQMVAAADRADDAAPELTMRQQLIQEAVRATMPGIWRHTFRGRRSFLVPSQAA